MCSSDLQGRGKARERGEALEPPCPHGPGIERLSGSLVVGRDPRCDRCRGTILEPAVRIVHLDAVQDVDVVASPRGGRRRHGEPGLGAYALSDVCALGRTQKI